MNEKGFLIKIMELERIVEGKSLKWTGFLILAGGGRRLEK